MTIEDDIKAAHKLEENSVDGARAIEDMKALITEIERLRELVREAFYIGWDFCKKNMES